MFKKQLAWREEEFEIRAAARNANRPLLKRILYYIGRTTPEEIGKEYQTNFDAAIDLELSRGGVKTREGAFNRVIKLPEFQLRLKSADRIKMEEYVRAKLRPVEKAIDRDKYYEACLKFSHIKYKEILKPYKWFFKQNPEINKEILDLMEVRITDLVKKRLAKKIAENDGNGFVNIINWFGVFLKKNDLAVKEIKKKVFSDAITDHIISSFRSYVDIPEMFAHELKKFAKLGLDVVLSKADFEKLVVIARKNALITLRYGYDNSRQFNRLCQWYDRLGIISIADMFSSPQVIRAADERGIVLHYIER